MSSNDFVVELIRVVEADLNLPEHQKAVLAMIDAYSRDPMGGAKSLDPDVRARLIPGLQRHPTTAGLPSIRWRRGRRSGGLFYRFLDLRRQTAHQHS